MTNTVTFTLQNPTIAQLTAIAAVITQSEASAHVGTEAATAIKELKKAGKAAKSTKAPEPTIDEDDELEASDFAADDIGDDDEESNDADVPELDFDTVRAAVLKLGKNRPEVVKAIYKKNKIENTKDLQKKPKAWEAVYEAVSAKLDN